MSLAYVFPPESRAHVKGLCAVIPGNRSWGLERLNREGGNTSTKIYYGIDHHLGNWRSILLEVSEMPCRILLRITHLRDHGRWKHLCMTLIPHWPRFIHVGVPFPSTILRMGEVPDRKQEIPGAAEATYSQVTLVKVVLTLMTGVKCCLPDTRWGRWGVCCSVWYNLMWIPWNTWGRGGLWRVILYEQIRITLELGV